MQMFKKSVALILSILMLLSMLTVAAGMSAFAAESYKVTTKSTQGLFADTTKTYSAGDTFDLKVDLTIDKPLCNGTVFVRFNPEALFVTSFTKGPNMSGDSVTFQAGGANNQNFQTKRSFVTANFSCGTDAADYSTQKLLFTVGFTVKDAIAADQVVQVDFQSLDGITDPLDINTEFPYIDNSAVVEAQKNNISLAAEMTGGSTVQPTEPETQATTEAPTTEAPTTEAPTTEAPTTEAPEPTTVPPTVPNTYTTKFTNNQGWSKVYLYAWDGNGAENAAWPGVELTEKSTNGYGEEQYTATFDSKWKNIIFNNGSEQTVDIVYDPTVTGYYPKEKNTNGKWEVGTWTDEQPTSEQATTQEPTEASTTVPPTQDSTTVPPTTAAPSKTFYLFGYINGADYACEADADNMGDYKFVNGTLKATFDQTSYVAVKEENNANWYMTNGWQGEVNSATLYNTSDLGTDANKLYVPGNVEVTFTLVDNGDGTLGLSYTTAGEETTAAPEGTTAAPEGTTAAPEGTTAVPEGTTAAPEGTTAAPQPEMYTFYYLPSAEQEDAGYTYKLNFNDPNGTAPENWHNYTFSKTPITIDGVNLYSVQVPKDFDDVTELQYQVYNGDTWVSQIKLDNVKLSAYDNQVMKADGTVEPEVPTQPDTTAAPEGTTAAPEGTTAAPEGTTAAPEGTTAAPEGTTAAPEGTTAAPEGTTAAPEGTTAAPEGTTAAPEGTTAAPEETTVAPTEAPTTAAPTETPTDKPAQPTTLAPSKVNFDKNPDEASAVNAISKAKSDGDPKGSKFSKLKAKVAKTTKNSNKISWTKVKGAKKYIVMGNKCGKTNGKFNAFKKLKTTTGKSFTQKGLKKGTYYKYLVLAVNGKGKVISASKVMHVATKGGKVTNYKKLKLNKTKKTLKKGKIFKLRVTKKIKMFKGKVKNHRKIKYESANTEIATVNAKGKIKAKKKGTTYVYAYAQNGVFARIKIKVK